MNQSLARLNPANTAANTSADTTVDPLLSAAHAAADARRARRPGINRLPVIAASALTILGVLAGRSLGRHTPGSTVMILVLVGLLAATIILVLRSCNPEPIPTSTQPSIPPSGQPVIDWAASDLYPHFQQAPIFHDEGPGEAYATRWDRINWDGVAATNGGSGTRHRQISSPSTIGG